MPSSSLDTVYIDTCALLWYFNRPAATKTMTLQEARDRQAKIELLLHQAEYRMVSVITSVYTKVELAYVDEEIRIGKLKPEIPQLIDAVLDNNKLVMLINVSPAITDKARDIVRMTKFSGKANVKPKDAIHIASALVYKADKLYTYDGGMLKWNNNFDGLKICHPDVELPPIR